MNERLIKENPEELPAIAKGAMLVDLSISQWTGRKKNNAVSDEVTASKNARSKKAVSVYNTLLGDCKELEDISKFTSQVRKRHLELTLPWADTGTRLLPLSISQEYMDFINEARQEFEYKVSHFLGNYNNQISKAAFDLGSMFDRALYPTVESLQHKFSLQSTFSPVPLSGDFRLDVDHKVRNALVQEYEKAMATRLNQANEELWNRLFKHLERMVDRLDVPDDGKPNIFKDTLITNAHELIKFMRDLNVTNDPELERARLALIDAINGKDPETLRSDIQARLHTKQKLQTILEDFAF